MRSETSNQGVKPTRAIHRALRFALKALGALLLFLMLGVLAVYVYQNRVPDYQELDDHDLRPYLQALSDHSLSPQEYVLQKFSDHRVVILGEPHRIREHYEFLIDLLRPLQRAGVHHIAVEFFTSQDDIDSLLSRTYFDEQLARKIVLSTAACFYYQELFDLLKHAWELNMTEPGFHLIALYQGGSQRDLNMAQTIARYVGEGHKVLVYCGKHHAFTKYSQPSIDFWRTPHKRDRMGNYLHDDLVPDAFFINFHVPFPKRFWLFVPILLYRQGYCLPFAGVLDQVFQKYGAPVGFDTALAPFSTMTDRFSYYSLGYGSIQLSDFCDGYIYLKPLSQYSFVRPLSALARTAEEREFIKGRVPEGLYHLFETEEIATAFLSTEGITPSEMLAMLDVRDFDHEF